MGSLAQADGRASRRAIQLAIREGCAEMDLGGVDVAGAREEPEPGGRMAGLYDHKRSFGASWMSLVGAHELVMDPRGYRVGRLAQRVAILGRRARRRLGGAR